MFEWDEAKRASNLIEHRLDFEDAALVFDGRPVLELAGKHPERRMLTVAFIGDAFLTVIWTRRGDNRRIISMRRARHEERRAYRELYG